MKKQDFYFDLPQELVAQSPLPNRGDSRMLTYHRQNQQHQHQSFRSLPDFLEPGDLLVMNNSRVIPARFFGTKESGGRVEFLVERLQADNLFMAHIKASKAPKAGMTIYLDNDWQIIVVAKCDDLYQCRVVGNVDEMLHEIGHIPLPPYITRHAEEDDKERYQTVYAKHKGSVAAPTAGLHFDETMLALLKAKGVNIAYSTLHVGAGTFRPVRCENVVDHKMHSEQSFVSQELCTAVNDTHAAGKRVIAVGTTALRSLESAAHNGILHPFQGDTDIFIYPGYQFNICDGLLTNFHLPESTLLMLVAAFIGYEQMLALYQEAIAEKYRFFSYGDTSLLL